MCLSHLWILSAVLWTLTSTSEEKHKGSDIFQLLCNLYRILWSVTSTTVLQLTKQSPPKVHVTTVPEQFIHFQLCVLQFHVSEHSDEVKLSSFYTYNIYFINSNSVYLQYYTKVLSPPFCCLRKWEIHNIAKSAHLPSHIHFYYKHCSWANLNMKFGGL